jgi:hypothetical protein
MQQRRGITLNCQINYIETMRRSEAFLRGSTGRRVIQIVAQQSGIVLLIAISTLQTVAHIRGLITSWGSAF